jgi:hypothetical protein
MKLWLLSEPRATAAYNPASTFVLRQISLARRQLRWNNLQITPQDRLCFMKLDNSKRLNADPGGRAVAGIAGLNPARGMDVCLLCLYVVLSCVGRGLCDGLITRPEESYCVSNCVWSQKSEKGPYVPVGNRRKMNEWWMKRPNSQNVYVISIIKWKANLS